MSDLDELKKLLFGAEQQTLESISERVESREFRSADVADILPEAIHASHRQGGELTESLRSPVGECLQQEFRDDPETYGDALYPVIGPAIRKSIMHALRGFAQQINEAVEQSLTPKGLSWRWQAARAGVPFAEFIMQKTLLYRVEQAYLISRENGLLVAHAQHEAAKIKDSDAVSAMFTAIQDFVKESFSPDRTGRLESADMGEFTLWAVHGPHALLVCVIRGVPPRSLRTDLSAILERIHFRYGDAIRLYSGDTASVPNVEEELIDCLQLEARQEKKKKGKGMPLPILALLLVASAAVLYYGISTYLQTKQLGELRSALENTPGIFLSDATVEDGRYHVTGMRDPAGATVASVATALGLSVDDVVANMQPFHSLDSELIAARAQSLLGAADDLDYRVDDDVLVIAGPAPVDLQQRARGLVGNLAGIGSVAFEQTPDERLDIVASWLQPPPSVQLTATDSGVALTGSAPSRWIAAARQQVLLADLGWPIDFSALGDDELQQLLSRADELNGSQFQFESGARLTPAVQRELQAFAVEIAAVAAELRNFDTMLRVSITGEADAVGSPAVNEQVSARRAAVVAAALAEAGWDGEPALLTEVDDAGSTSGTNASLRRATVAVRTVRSASE
ncbi:MAG: OmpA family protein [Gammaproteobacteria bacterium]|nr:OmpA family protein [Gammaproteobacteria bacterium]